jgi:hypothetical protein
LVPTCIAGRSGIGYCIAQRHAITLVRIQGLQKVNSAAAFLEGNGPQTDENYLTAGSGLRYDSPQAMIRRT